MTTALHAEDAKIQAEKDIIGKTAKDAAVAAGSSSDIPQGESVNTRHTNAGSRSVPETQQQASTVDSGADSILPCDS